MWYRKLLVIGALVAMLVVSVGAVGAQGGMQGRRGGPMDEGLMFDVMGLLTETTGLDLLTIHTELRGGATVAELITANGGDVDAFTAEAVALVTEQVNAAVEAGEITQARADLMLANLEARITEIVNGQMGLGLRSRFQDRAAPGGMMPGNMGRGGMGRGDMAPGGRFGNGVGLNYELIALAAEQTGIEITDLSAQLRDGATLVEILQANGVEVTAFIDSAIDAAETRMNVMSDQRLAMLRDRLEAALGVTTAE